MASTYSCDMCDASFLKPSLLQKHKRTVHSPSAFTCNVCRKTFGRKDNLDRHLTRHTSGEQHGCSTCGKVFNRPDNLRRHLVQHGGSKRTAERCPDEQTKRSRLDNPKDFYEIKKIKEKYMAKFKTTATDFRATFRDIEVDGLSNILATLRKIFASIMDDLTVHMAFQVLVQLVVQCPELDYPIVLPFLRQSDLTVDHFLFEVEKVLQSYEEFVLDSSLEIQVTHVAMPSGGKGKKSKYVDLDKFLKDKRCIIRIQNRDSLCCARAIVTAKAKLDEHEEWEAIRHGYSIQRDLARALHRDANVPEGKCGIDQMKLFQSVIPGYQLNVVSKDHFNAIIYSGPEAEKHIWLYHRDGHYDVITSMPAFLNRSYFCLQCHKGYNTKEEHGCNKVCGCCFKIHENGQDDAWMNCSDCHRYFKGQTCFDNHQRETDHGNSTCNTHYRCLECHKVIKKFKRKDAHRCGETFCQTCREYVLQDHSCFMKRKYLNGDHKKKSDSDDLSDEAYDEGESDDDDVLTYIFYDFECTQDDSLHVPNLCVAHKVCELCLGKNECGHCGEREHVFSGPSTQSDFCQWLFSGENSGAICIAHNFRGYDAYFVLSYLYDNALLPKIIFNGANVMSMQVSACDMTFIDSMNFLPMALSKLPATFGIKELAKGHFPHFYNCAANQDAHLSHLPDAKYYGPDAMKPKDRAKFYQWYEKHRNDAFHLQQELLKYCKSDVQILQESCLRFRDLFMSMTSSAGPGIDPFKHCITIASACNLVFRTQFIQPNTIGIIPPHGYHPEQKQSVVALQWLKYLSKTESVRIQHAKNGKEFKIGRYPVDGYYETPKEKVVLQFEGCFWHGCPKCFARDTVNPFNGKTMDELYQSTIDKKMYMESLGYVYVQKWGCEWEKEKQGNKDIQTFVERLEMVTPLEPRSAFYGGRTETFKLYKKAEPGQKIKYVDYTSLYPFVNKTQKYPVGHPKIITENFQPLESYEGLIKCKVLPPRGLYLPVLPCKMNGKLLFPLCRTCAEHKQQSCEHEQEERAFTGTWVTNEVKAAVQKGYQILKIYEVWQFDETAQYNPITKEGGLFTSYINAFLKVKQEASDWPDWCSTEDLKCQYIDDYFRKEGVRLDRDRIEKNPGLRALAKLMLNSFWGKFGQRSNLPQTTYIDDPCVYFDLLTSDKQKVKSVRFVNDSVVEVQWQYAEDFIEPSARTNVVLAAYTTAHARLKLYELLESVGSDRVLYADTDSAMYTVKDREEEPPLGVFLGELTDELNGNHIETFASAGPKNYAFKLAKPDDDGNKTHCKIRGITLNYKNSLDIHFDTVSNIVRGIGPSKVTVTDTHKICCEKSTSSIVTKEMSKDYRVVFDKRVIVPGYDTVPYGF